MKKYVLILLIMLICTFGFAQEIKIKKGQVMLDGKPIANIESKMRNYKISNLDGNPRSRTNPFVCYAELYNKLKMSRNYKFHNPNGLYFISFAVVGWLGNVSH